MLHEKIVCTFQFSKFSPQSSRLRELVVYGKNRQNKPNGQLTDQLHKDTTLSAKISQIETN